MDTVERIVLYQENKLPEQYLFPLYAQIASREELLSLEESKRLGYDSLVPIHQARERLRSQGSMNNRLLSPIRTGLKPTEIIDIVASTFKISLGNASLNSGNVLLYLFPADVICLTLALEVLGPAFNLTPLTVTLKTTLVDRANPRRVRSEVKGRTSMMAWILIRL